MPNFCLEVPEIRESVIRPVAIEVIRQMIKDAGLPSNVSVRYPNAGGALPIPDSEINPDNIKNRFPGDENITVTVDDEYMSDYVRNNAVRRDEYPLFFKDYDLRVFMKPVYQKMKLTIQVKYIAADQTTAKAWVTTLRRRFNEEFYTQLHRVDYSYPVPLPMIVILHEIHRLREANKGYNEDLGTWLRRCFSEKMTVAATQANTEHTIMIRETQVGIEGYYDFLSEIPKPEKENESGNWSVSFSYIATFDLPDSVYMEYPLVVHNQYIDHKLYSRQRPERIEDVLFEGGKSTMLLRDYSFDARNNAAWVKTPGISIPYFDDWLPKVQFDFMQTVFRIRLLTDPNNPKAILNLANDLVPYSLKQKALEYIRAYPVGLTQPFESLFSVSLHSGPNLVTREGLVVQSNLDIYSMKDLDERKNYHLHVEMMCDISKLTVAAQKRLCVFGEFAIEYIKLIDPNATLPKLLPNGSIPYLELKKTISKYRPTKVVRNANVERLWAMVGGVAVITQRNS